MKQPVASTTRRPVAPVRRAAGARNAARAPTILIAGVVHYVDRLHEAAEIERTRLRGVVSHTARSGPDVVVVGTASPASGALEVIGELKRHPAASAVPVLHLFAPGTACGACGADVCLPADAAASTLLGTVRLLLRLRRAERLSAGAASLLEAEERAGALTRPLLAFGRRSPAQPRLVDVNEVLAQLDPMLLRLIGTGVRLDVRAGRGLGRVRADLSQIEQLLLDLALNARDAMPQGGRLTIETHDVEIAGGTAPPVPPGRYVMLAVSDEGVGMDVERPAAEGSGLGLATVHQVVRQAGGCVRVDSEPGLGTTFRIYLPCATGEDEPKALTPETGSPPLVLD